MSELATKIKMPDIYLTHMYGQITEISDKGEWQVAIWDNGRIIYPYLKKPIKYDNKTYYDLQSPYGYSGIFCDETVTEEEFLEFRKEFLINGKKKGYLTEFIRFSPYLNNKLFGFYQLKSQTVGIDLQEYPEKSSKRHRRYVKKALTHGYQGQVEVANTENINQFVVLYEKTMDRLNAKPYYYFSKEYYQKLLEYLKDHLIIVTVKKGNHLVASAIYFQWKPYLHYHLGGSDEDHLKYGINNFLHHVVASYGKENGYQLVHLGGGNKKGDSLFEFKKSVGNKLFDYYLGKNIINPEIYNKLSQYRPDSDHFPCYHDW